MRQRQAPSVSTQQSDDALDWLVTDQDLEQRGFGDRSTRWRQVQAGRFPKPIQLSPGCKRWRWSTIVQFLKEREAHPVPRRAYFGKAKPESAGA